MKRQAAQLACVSALAFAGWMAPASAQFNAVFEGNTTRVCVSASSFDANLALLGTGNISSASDVAVTTFRDDGTGTQVVRSLSISHGATGVGATPASESESTCDFNYTVSGTGLVSLTFGSCLANILTGPNAGQQIELSGLAGDWQFVDRRTTLVGVTTTPRVESQHNLTTGFTSQRICHRTSTRFVLR